MNISVSLAIKAIDYYQSNLSHKKKYRCAHWALYKGLTCSSYSKEVIKQKGIFFGIYDTFKRLFACWQASKKIKETYTVAFGAEQKEKQNKKSKSDSTDDCFTSYLALEAGCCLASLWPF